jgi:hypothetical protein
MTFRKNFLISAIAALGFLLAACGGGGNNPPAAISVAFSPAPPTSMVVSATASITAVVSSDSKNAGVTWTVTCGSAACGTFNPAATPSGTATTYTAPAAIPTGNTVTVVATSVTDTTKSASATITITATAPVVIADGTYIFHLNGEDTTNSGSPYFAAGAFTIKSGAITGGEEDVVDIGGGGTFTISSSGSSVSKASDGNIAIVLNTGSSGPGVGGVQTFRGTAVSASRVLISEFDTFAAGTGSLDLQTSQAAPTGGYAFNLGGLDGGNPANALFIGGTLNISGTSLSTSGSVFDYWDGGTVAQKQSFTSGAITAPDSFGRVTISLTPSQASGAVEFGVAGYIVGTNAIRLVELSNDNLQGALGGNALGQGSNTGNFTAAGVGGNGFVFIATGEDINSVANYAGGFSLNADSTVSGVLAYSDTAADQGLTITGGSWTVDPTGRVTLSNVTVSGSTSNITGPFTFQLYLDGNSNALELGLDSFQGTTGPSYLQTSGAVNPGSYAIAAQGFANANGLPVWSAVGPVTLDSNLNWSGFTDYNVFSGTPIANVALSGTTDTSTGLFSITGLNAVSPTPSTPEFGYYPVDGSRVLAIEVDNNQLGLFIIETVTQ